MLDIKDLENRWKKYNKKRRRPFILFGSLFVVIGGGFFVIHNKLIDIDRYIPQNVQQQISNVLKNNNSSSTKESTPQVEIVQQKQTVQQNSISKDTYILNSKIDTIDTGKESTVVQSKIDQKTTSVEADPNSPIDPDEVFVDSDIAKPIIEKKTVKIIKVANTNAYKDVEKRFKRSHNINDAIFLANMYYKKKDYKKAIYWAMQTNKLDNNIEESWLIFAKSKAKIGHKNEAIRILREYIKRSNSYEAKKLLKKLVN